SASRNYRDDVGARGGNGEFKEVAAFFNGLARELADLYKGMEEKIISRSRELVRSERLASVGFLAAGVAHEINNPLSVISGYAELSLRQLNRADDAALHEVSQALQIIRDEAFRCKEITGKLLSLARGGSSAR